MTEQKLTKTELIEAIKSFKGGVIKIFVMSLDCYVVVSKREILDSIEVRAGERSCRFYYVTISPAIPHVFKETMRIMGSVL